MAEAAKEEELEYESDPEETKLSLKMRRREASDDEEEADGGDGEDSERGENFIPRRRIVDSDVESDGQGAAAEYEDDEEEDYAEEEEDEELIDEEDYAEEDEAYGEERRDEIGEAEAVGKEAEAQVEVEGRKESLEDRVRPKSIEGLQGSNDDGHFGDGSNENQQGEEVGEEEEKKEIEPYAVPTAGAFYMHDDRFRDNAGGRNRYQC